MSAEEFTQWVVWMSAEQIGPLWDRLRHAQLMAAACNSGRVERKDKRLFQAEDFLTDPWEQEKPVQQQTKDQLLVELAYIEDCFEG